MRLWKFILLIVINFEIEKNLPFSKEKILSVILDVSKYSEFIPWCKVDLKSKTDDIISTKVLINYGIFKYSFDCDVKKSESTVFMSGSKFLQFSFDAKWTVNQSNADSTSVKFDISIKTPLAILTKRLQNIISNVSLETIDMFIKRINFLYKDGNK